jgi:hypothetical protein
VRGIGEQHLVSLHQRLDPAGGLVEALGELRDLVAPLDCDARAEIPGAERLHALLQPFQPPRQPPCHRQRPERHRDRNRAKESNQHERGRAVRTPNARDEPAAVGQMDRIGGAGAPGQPARTAVGAGSRNRPTRGSEPLAGSIEQRNVGSEARRKP